MRKYKLTGPAEQLLLESIIGWQALVDGDKQWWENTCPLCPRYGHERRNCKSCPIKIATGKASCRHTPYYDARDDYHPKHYEAMLACLHEVYIHGER